LSWFISYLSNRTFSITIDNNSSKVYPITTGVPQGSVLGPILFSIYTSQLSVIFKRWNIHYHLYADDTQVYVSYDSSEADLNIKGQLLSGCLEEVSCWMASHGLVLNPSKTQLLIVTPPKVQHPDKFYIKFQDTFIAPTDTVKNLGVYLDNKLSMTRHTSNICSSAYYYLRLITKNKSCLPKPVIQVLIQALVFSRIYYCNALLINHPAYLISRLQRIQNAAARSIFSLPLMQPVTPFLRQLHWLPVKSRITYKVMLL
jgi:hypothetical protein